MGLTFCLTMILRIAVDATMTSETCSPVQSSPKPTAREMMALMAPRISAGSRLKIVVITSLYLLALRSRSHSSFVSSRITRSSSRVCTARSFLAIVA